METEVKSIEYFQEKDYNPVLQLRGLHIDISRHFISLQMLLKIVDMMSNLKLNTLHLHLSDDQGFPLELKCLDKFPKSFQNLLKQENQPTQKILSIKDQEILFQECSKRGIQIIPEIDVPGHSQAFLSIFEDSIKPATQMGIVTDDYINIEKHLPILFEIFEELVVRFQAKYFHMGGDEAKKYTEFNKLILLILEWAQKRNIQIIAWDEVVTAVNWENDFPFKTLVIQQWRNSARKDVQNLIQKFPQTKLIVSVGYYLDHALDPIKVYLGSPQHADVVPYGCIACTWTELIDENNILSTIFPVMYAVAHRWWYFPKFKSNIIGEILFQISEQFGYYDCVGFENSWKSRHWVGFYSEQPRSSSSVTVYDPLDREQDKYPVFSKSLIKIVYYLEKYMKLNNKKTQDQLQEVYDKNYEDLIVELGNQAIPKEIFTEIQEENLLFIIRRTKDYKVKLKKIVEALKQIHEEETKNLKQLYRNGFISILQYAMTL